MDSLPSFAGLDTQIDANPHGAVRWDLNWNILSDADGLHIDAYYNRDLFDPARVQSWLARYTQILESFIDAPQPTPTAYNAAKQIETLAGRVTAQIGSTTGGESGSPHVSNA